MKPLQLTDEQLEIAAEQMRAGDTQEERIERLERLVSGLLQGYTMLQYDLNERMKRKIANGHTKPEKPVG